jgi:NAD(P)-dependent dehydrogenase (short-subunit alcohol dehydrogenase family)
VIAGRRGDSGETVVRRIGAGARLIKTDVAIEGDVRSMIEGAVAKFGRLDCLVNNAGVVGRSGVSPSSISMITTQR